MRNSKLYGLVVLVEYLNHTGGSWIEYYEGAYVRSLGM